VQDKRCHRERHIVELATAYLCLGSNLGEREENLLRSLRLLGKTVKLERISSLYETEPIGYKQQPLFLNLACSITTDLTPEDLLRLAKKIESSMGRVPSFPNAPRIIDIDILFYDDKVIETPNLTIPHPRLQERAFVLRPLQEIAPHLVHPRLGKSIAQLAKTVKGKRGVRKYKGGTNVSAICGRPL